MVRSDFVGPDRGLFFVEKKIILPPSVVDIATQVFRSTVAMGEEFVDPTSAGAELSGRVPQSTESASRLGPG
jgi:hypothetical protein